MTVVSVLEMELALKNTLGKKGMENEDLKKLAEYIAGFFGYAGSVIDNRLASEDRDIFYMFGRGRTFDNYGRRSPFEERKNVENSLLDAKN